MTEKHTTYWHCDRCGCTGSHGSTRPEEAGVWEVAQSILTRHHAVAPACTGGRDTIRVAATKAALLERAG